MFIVFFFSRIYIEEPGTVFFYLFFSCLYFKLFIKTCQFFFFIERHKKMTRLKPRREILTLRKTTQKMTRLKSPRQNFGPLQNRSTWQIIFQKESLCLMHRFFLLLFVLFLAFLMHISKKHKK